MITLEKIYDLIEKSQNPLIFFDDDPDGLCSYLLIKKHFKKGHPVVVKSSPILEENYYKRVKEYSPDLVIILDKPIVKQEFIDKVNVPIIYIDHHPIQNLKGVYYFNPLFNDKKDNRPTTYWCYKLTKENLWIAAVGTAADYSSATVKKFNKEFPDLCQEEDLEKIIYETKLGKLIRIFWFILKDPHYKVLQYVNILEKIKTPYELLKNTSKNSKEIIRIYKKVDKEYKKILNKALRSKKSKVHVFLYTAGKISFTGELAGELKSRFPNKLIIVGRQTDDRIKMSLRYQQGNVRDLLQKAMKDLDGYGGGHEHACGGNINSEDFKMFVERLERYLK